MKKLNKTKSFAIISLSFLMILLSRCDLKGVTDDLEIEITNNILQQEALITVLDIVNPEKIEGSDKLKVKLIGPDASKFVTNSGENASNLKVVNGTISLAVNPNFASTEPLKVLLKISGEDYLTTTIPVVMFPEDTLVTKSINIVNKLNTVEGIDIIEDNKTLIGNSLTENHTISTTKTKASTKTEVIIESGTFFLDADGNTITGGTLKSEVAHFSLDTPESIASFPGGLTPLSVIDENGEENEDSSFITAGFTSIDMFVDGKEVKNFSKPISVGIEIPKNYTNPETGNNIAPGDEIPIWSYDEDGQWGYHKIGTVTTNSSGNYNIVFTTTHLSWYNLDYHYWGICDYGRKTTVSIPKIPNLSDNFHQLSYELVYAVNDQVIARRDIQVSKTTDNANGYYNTPNQSLKIKVYYGRYYDSNRKLLYTSEAFNGCNNNTITIAPSNLSDLPVPQEIKNVYVQFQAKCGDKILNPFFYLYRQESYTYYGRTYSYWRIVGYVWGGYGYINNAKIGVEQKYATYYAGQVYIYDYTFNSDRILIEDFQAPGDLCDRLF